MEPLSEPSQRSAAVFGAYLGLAAAAVLFVLLTVNRRTEDELQHGFAERTHAIVTFWQTHGYFASAGLAVLTPAVTGRTDAPFHFYRTSSGAWMLPALIVENLARAIEGRDDWRLLASVNMMIASITAALLALLCYRLALRFGTAPRHAFCLGACVLAVNFTFPNVLAFYWELLGEGLTMPFCIAFLLLNDGVIAVERRRLVIQAVVVFAMVYLNWVVAGAFLISFIAVHLVLQPGAARWREWLAWIAAPAAAALLLFAMQLLVAHVRYPSIPMTGSSFMFRSGLDGDARYYRDHTDILYGRDVARANFTHNRAQLFRWPALFVAGLASLMAMLLLYLRNRLPSSALVALVALTGSYALYAAVFSQSTVIHPYLFDYLLVTPMMLALFGLLPAFGEAVSENRGVFVLVTLFATVWYAMVQLRDYALWFPRV